MKCSAPLKLKLEKSSEYHVATAGGLGYAAVPCGVCHNCRVNQSRIWRNRLLLEQCNHGNSAFVTLTYDDKNIPDPPHVNKVHLQKYLKRLRYYVDPIKIRYFAVGEYGDRTFRPHYHVALYGLDFLLNRETIKKAWMYCDPEIGIDIGELNQKSAWYITKYVTKKSLKIENKHPVNYGKKDEFMICSKGLGKEPAIDIAKQLSVNKHWDKKKILKVIARGRKKYPLGRFLVRKCAKEMGVSENEFILQFWANQEIAYHEKGKVTKYKERGSNGKI